MTTNPAATPLRIDLTQTIPLNAIWSFGGNTCHAPLWLRDDLCRHLEIARSELGFRFVRAHGPLGDGMRVVQPDGSFDFSRMIAGLDRLLERGFKPFLELSHMPSALASNDRSIAEYRFRSAPPKDWTQWYELIREMMSALIEHYGLEELRHWYFEVWNEPDIAFWSGSRAEYFKLYDLAARAIKQADPQLRVGGPATARTNWIDEFLEHVTTPCPDYELDAPRCDFIATHAYPSDLEFLDSAEGEVQLQSSDVMRQLFGQVRRKVDAVMGAGFPVICGEWNSSAGPLAFNHDDCNNAAFIAKTMVELSDLCQGSLVWNISDIYEECGFHHKPFHGGYGLLTVNDIPKAAFHAFAFLHEHDGGERLSITIDHAPAGLGALASREGQTLRLLLYYYREPEATNAEAVEVTLEDLSWRQGVIRTVLPGQGSAFETWQELGRPSFVNRDVLDRLEAASIPAQATFSSGDQRVQLAPGTIAQIEMQLDLD